MATVKVLSITSLQFRLSDDFNGGITEALSELIEYHNNVESTQSSVVQQIDKDLYSMPYGRVSTIAFDNFIDAIQSGKRLMGLFKIDSCDVSDVEATDG